MVLRIPAFVGESSRIYAGWVKAAEGGNTGKSLVSRWAWGNNSNALGDLSSYNPEKIETTLNQAFTQFLKYWTQSKETRRVRFWEWRGGCYCWLLYHRSPTRKQLPIAGSVQFIHILWYEFFDLPDRYLADFPSVHCDGQRSLSPDDRYQLFRRRFTYWCFILKQFLTVWELCIVRIRMLDAVDLDSHSQFQPFWPDHTPKTAKTDRWRKAIGWLSAPTMGPTGIGSSAVLATAPPIVPHIWTAIEDFLRFSIDFRLKPAILGWVHSIDLSYG